jgi:hypothetical protein
MFLLTSVLLLSDVVVIFEVSRSTNSKWQFLSCATIVFSERLTQFQPSLNSLNTNKGIYTSAIEIYLLRFIRTSFYPSFLPPAPMPQKIRPISVQIQLNCIYYIEL